jgi:hypothetical protein
MCRLRWFCALLLFVIAVHEVKADIGYSYVADQASYSGLPGSTVSVKLYLVETVTPSGTNQTSLINRYFANSNFSITYSGVSSIGLGVEQTGQSGSVRSQILGPSIFSPTIVGYNGVANNAGFTFGPDFTYVDFTQNTSGGPVKMTGGSSIAMLYQNLNDPITGFNGNNLQVKAALVGNANSMTGYNNQNGVLTDAVYDPVNDVYSSGKILVGTLSISVGQGATTFQVKPLAQTTLQAGPTTSFNTIPLNGAFGSTSGTTTVLSGTSPSFAPATLLAVTAFGGAMNLDQSYTDGSRPSSASFNSFNSVSSLAPVTGPFTIPATSSALPAYAGTGSIFTFSVASVPEPSSFVLGGLLAAAGAVRLLRRRVA